MRVYFSVKYFRLIHLIVVFVSVLMFLLLRFLLYNFSLCLKLIFSMYSPEEEKKLKTEPTEQYLLLGYGHKINFIFRVYLHVRWIIWPLSEGKSGSSAHVCSGEKCFAIVLTFYLRRSLRMEFEATSINSLSCVMNSLGRSAGALVRLSNAIAIVFLCWRAGKGNTRKTVFSRENFRSLLIFIRHAAGNTLNSFGFILLFLHAHAKIARRHENIYRAREHTRGERESAGSELFS